jgi:hypothetical protein
MSRPEQERVLIEAIDSRLANTADEALDQALDLLRRRLPQRIAGCDPRRTVLAFT